MKIRLFEKEKICVNISNTELEEHDLKPAEISIGTEKAKQFVNKIMEYAEKTLNFDTQNKLLKIEAVPTDSENITLIISKI